MALFRRRTTLPAADLATIDLAPSDRVLAAAEVTGGWAAASQNHLHLVLDGATVRHAWSDVDGARFDPEGDDLSITWVDGTAPTVLHLVDPESVDLPRTVYERVQSSVVHREAVQLPSGTQVRVAVRRGVDGELFTQVIGTGDVDLADPATAAVVDAAEARVREAVGLL